MLFDSERMEAPTSSGSASSSQPCVKSDSGEAVSFDSGSSMGVWSSCGGRTYQDDRWNAFSFYMDVQGQRVRCTVGAVLDGHHGHGVSDMVSQCLPNALIAKLKDYKPPVAQSAEDFIDGAIRKGLHDCIFDLDTWVYNEYARDHTMTGGTTILVLLVVLETGLVYTSNVGDCKAVMSVLGRAESLTESHNPPVPSEKKRFEEAGVACFSDHIGGSDINVCRTIGDYDLGPPLRWRESSDGFRLVHGPLSCVPELSSRRLDDLDEFIIIATDGVWDYYTPESSIVTDVRRQLRQCSSSSPVTNGTSHDASSKDFTSACMHCASWLVDASLSRQRDVLHEGTPGDNVTVMFLQMRSLPKIPRARDSRLHLPSMRAP
jgi:serine/threonine protein phosphatase PrpC